MSSVTHTNGDYLTSADEPTVTGDWTFGMWIKFQSGNYTSGFPTILSWDDGANEFIYVQTQGATGGTTDMAAGLFNNPGADEDIIATGSYTGWIFVAFRHASGSSDYTLSYRKEGVSTLTHSTLNAGAQFTTISAIRVGSDQASEHAIDASSRSLFVRSDRLSDADLLTASSSLSPPTGTNHTELDLDSPTSAGSNPGTGADYTVTGTLGTDASEPNPSIGGGGGGGAVRRRMLLGVGF